MLEAGWTNGFLFAFFRGLGLAAVLPLGSWFEGALRRITLAFGIGLLFAASAGGVRPFGAFSMLGEFLTGLVVGLPWALGVEGAGMLGELFETGRGQNIAEAYDPMTQLPHAPLAAVLKTLMWTGLLFAGGAEEMLLGLERSFAAVPGGAFAPAGTARLGLELLLLCGGAFGAVLKLFLPFGLLFFAADAAIGFAAKLLPAGNFFGEAFQLKSYTGLCLLAFLSQSNWAAVVRDLCTGWTNSHFS